MEVIPAIDLRQGRCVRLYQGDYAQETVFSPEPVKMALHWQSLGARRLHVVDLDGAEKGEPGNLGTIEGIARAVRIPVQAGGGIRSLETLARLLEAGAQRVILGTAAVEDARLVEEACRRYGDRLIISLDAREGYVATRGWKETSALRVPKVAERMAALGVRRFIYTDILRDGTLAAPNFEAIAELVSRTRLPIIASGGISSLEHLRRLQGLGVEGAIVGQALYTGELDLKEALRGLRRGAHPPLPPTAPPRARGPRPDKGIGPGGGG